MMNKASGGQPPLRDQRRTIGACLGGWLRPVAAVWGAALVFAVLVAQPATAAAPSPLRWASGGLAKDGDAVELLRIRGEGAGGREFSMRVNIANAGPRDGELQLSLSATFDAGSAAVYHTFEAGSYRVAGDRFYLQAGENVVETTGSGLRYVLVKDGTRIEGTISMPGAAVTASHRNGDGFIERTLLTSDGKAEAQLTLPDGSKGSASFRVFAVHDASSCPGHRVYDRSVQLYDVGAKTVILDYIVLPEDRGRKVLGFLAVNGGGVAFRGQVVGEQLSDLRPDKPSGYELPYKLDVRAEGAGKAASISVAVDKLQSRKDELSKQSFLVRKAVGMLFKPFNFRLLGSYTTDVSGTPGRAGKVSFAYGQTRK